MKRNKMKNLKNTAIVLGAIATVLILVSSATAVRQVSSITVINIVQTKDKEEQIRSSFEEFVKDLKFVQIVDLSEVETFEDLYKNKDFIAFMNSPEMNDFLQSKDFLDFYNSEPVQEYVNSDAFIDFYETTVMGNFRDLIKIVVTIAIGIMVTFAGLIFGVLTWIIGGPAYAAWIAAKVLIDGAERAVERFFAIFELDFLKWVRDTFEIPIGFIVAIMGAVKEFIRHIRMAVSSAIFALLMYPVVCAVFALNLYFKNFVWNEENSDCLLVDSARRSFV